MRRFLPVVIVLAYASCTRSTQAQTKSPAITPCKGENNYTLIDDGLGQLIHESDPNKRLALLDNFVAQNKSSRSMLVYIYPLYYRSYSEVKNFPMAMEYADKLLALGDKVGVSERYVALHEWAVAYNSLGSDDLTLAAKALARTREGIEVVQKIEKSECVDANTFQAQKRLATVYFHATGGAAAMKLKDYAAAHDSFRAIVTIGDQ